MSGLSYDLCLKVGAVKFNLQVIMPLQNYFVMFWGKNLLPPASMTLSKVEYKPNCGKMLEGSNWGKQAFHPGGVARDSLSRFVPWKLV